MCIDSSQSLKNILSGRRKDFLYVVYILIGFVIIIIVLNRSQHGKQSLRRASQGKCCSYCRFVAIYRLVNMNTYETSGQHNSDGSVLEHRLCFYSFKSGLVSVCIS